ncbi:DUF805 domain-containing protein [Pseudomonas sp. GD03842]|uniref:DUF805 domain-containing protein n=1 Tax=unclassified Pseudomonas TaxID=196821 RepID=UPI000D346FC6|nr:MULTISPECIES: DUF805 domain-containing protein [unclassified Pseudomonas]MDH0747466.1 DUF805 domain-containing protein [Pseudomonas sp. GD03842]RAU40883.1 DUF805 domain-containing protein [Pseudomonas sp. RIT 409]RAU53655.1 DUF805 domain-containing protein [Pseudomonas sp. RIT 412]
MAEHFKIVFEGQLRTGVDLETARLNLAQLFKTDVSSVDRLFSGKPITLKRGLTHDDAQRYLKALNDAGVDARVEAEQPVAWTLEDIEEPAPVHAALEQPKSPYAPPRSAVAQPWPTVGELKVFTVQGRIGRLRYLAWTMVLTFIGLLLAALCFGVMSLSLVAGGLLAAVLFVAVVVISIQMGAQRLHDAGWSAWLLLLNLVPFVGSFFPFLMMIIPGNSGPNRYGPPPPPNTRGVKCLAALWVIFLAVVFAGGLMGGLQKVKEEVEITTGEYEQSLPYDDDAEGAAEPIVPVDPPEVDELSGTDDDQ